MTENVSTMGEFKSWGSTPRWHKPLFVTEKIDGTNAGLSVQPQAFGVHLEHGVPEDAKLVFGPVDWSNDETPETEYLVRAQSRKRIITPDNDNYGFARWVWDNADALANLLGMGYHYGEWFGEGIQKNPLGIEGKRFALFNAWHWSKPENADKLEEVDGLEHVPVLHDPAIHGPANANTIPQILQGLTMFGSEVFGAKETRCEDGYFVTPQPEGIIVWHRETNQKYKILLDNDAFHKWEV